ncbi:MAG: hypothetical protein Q9163_000566 [Psora crenata]
MIEFEVHQVLNLVSLWGLTNTEAKGCYVLGPEDSNGLAQRPLKRRKTASIQEFNHPDEPLFVPLLEDKESGANASARFRAFEELWNPQEALITEIVNNTNSETVRDVACYVAGEKGQSVKDEIPAALLVAKPGNGISAHLLEDVARLSNERMRTILVDLASGQNNNLKSVLRSINQRAISQVKEFASEVLVESLQEHRRLNYDLEILHTLARNHSIKRVLVSLQDSEAFDGELLSDLINLLSSWCDRIPFVLLFGIATTVELFQSKLSNSAFRCIQGERFEVQYVDIETSGEVMDLWQLEHIEAVRNMSSFRRHCEKLLNKDYRLVRKLLDNASILKHTAKEALFESEKALLNINFAVNTLYVIRSKTYKGSARWSDIYILAMSGRLADSDLLQSSLSSFRKVQSHVTLDVLDALLKESTLPLEVKSCHDSLSQLVEETAATHPEGLRSGYDIQHSNLRTTVVAQRVELSKRSGTLTAQEAAYTKIMDKLDGALRAYFERNLIDPKDLLLYEACVYDLPSPHRDVFDPRPRFAVERALTSPHDYLGQQYCNGTSEGLSASQPATSILYNLYLESGSAINIADLWSAFWTIVRNDDAEEDQEEQRALALFSRALAELKYLGLIKHSRNKADHLVKLSWNGL